MYSSIGIYFWLEDILESRRYIELENIFPLRNYSYLGHIFLNKTYVPLSGYILYSEYKINFRVEDNIIFNFKQYLSYLNKNIIFKRFTSIENVLSIHQKH